MGAFSVPFTLRIDNHSFDAVLFLLGADHHRFFAEHHILYSTDSSRRQILIESVGEPFFSIKSLKLQIIGGISIGLMDL